MGIIRQMSTGRTSRLEPEHVFGRMGPPSCSQTLADPYVSGVHAVLRWCGEAWELKDLNSTNGTYVDGSRIPEASSLLVAAGAQIGFGERANRWELVDAGGPEAMAVPLDGGDPVRAEGDTIWILSDADPAARIRRAPDGTWFLKRKGEPLVALRNARTFDVGHRIWRFCCVDRALSTVAYPESPAPARLAVGDLHLRFAVSRDEEYVSLEATCGDRLIEFGDRAPYYLLLTLARRRLRDTAAGFPETSCGWVPVDELARDPTMAPPQLNIDVHRIRGAFDKHGVVDADQIIERRRRPRQLRIGTGRLSVSLL
jgi:hypothetical protein